MLFNSIDYLFFLPIVFLLYWIVIKQLRWQNLLIVVASYIFYGWWDYRFLLLIVFTTVCSYVCALVVDHKNSIGQLGGAKFYTIANIVINLLILGTFKYFNFFVESFSHLLNSIGICVHPVTLKLILPVGISFYTFQALSYTIDVYKGKLKATHDIVSFFAFISFFPQLVAGPIERATNLLPQFQRERRFDYAAAVDGTRQILWGLFKKMVVADNCADIVDKIWLDYSQHSSLMLIVAAILFSFQIYGDFSGYSDIAIGTAKLFGIKLMRNFNLPYFSRSVAEFWKRWHISLNTWFVDYVYIPLGGSREGKLKSIRNTFVIFLLSGLWHGANWTYVSWGFYHAALFVPLLLLNKNKKYKGVVAEERAMPSMREVFQMGSTFVLAAIGWIIFRANSIGDFWHYMTSILDNWGISDVFDGGKALFYIVIMLIVEWFNRRKDHALDIGIKNKIIRWSVYLSLALLCLTQAGDQVQFIYFQF